MIREARPCDRQARWLEIAVRAADSAGDLEVLEPRRLLAAAAGLVGRITVTRSPGFIND